jgi:uncharacterized protein with HEPN domain
MPPEIARYLQDMLEAVRAIEEITQGKTIHDYLQLRWMRDAAQWNFCVIGEALAQLRKLDAVTAGRITDHGKIIGLRNQLIHGYGVIDHQITWNIITRKLPVLHGELDQLLSE